jgi:hypothetical protein
MESAALLRKYVQLRTEGVRDALSPHHVLGLPAGATAEATVLRALRERLEQVSRVPAASEAEVSHVRMLLHASAAVMLSEGVGLRAMAGEGVIGLEPAPGGIGLGATGTGTAQVGRREDALSFAQPPEKLSVGSPLVGSAMGVRSGGAARGFDDALRIALGLHGGWNKRTMHHARLLAMSHGVGAHALVESLRRVGGERGSVGSGLGGLPLVGMRGSGPRELGARATPAQRDGRVHGAAENVGRGANEQSAQAAASAGAFVYDGPVEDPNAGVKRLFVGAGVGAALLLVVALALRYTIWRTPALVPGQPVAAGGAGAATTDGRGVGAGASGIASERANEMAAQSAAEGAENRAAQRAADRSVQELLAALQQAAMRGGVQRGTGTGEALPEATTATSTQPELSQPELFKPDPAKPVPVARDLDGSLVSFRDAMEELGQAWVSGSEQQLVAVSNAVVEYLYRVGDSDAHAQAAAAIIAGPALGVFGESGRLESGEAMRASVLSAGLLSRLRSERDLPWGTLERINRAGTVVFGAIGEPKAEGRRGLLGGAEAALRALPARLTALPKVDVPSAEKLWKAWRESAAALAGGNDAALAQHVLGALDVLVGSGLSPAQRPVVLVGYRALVPSAGFGIGIGSGVGQASAQATEKQAETLAGRASRQRLLGWLASPGVGSEHVSVMVSTLIESKQGGLDLSMSLTAGASEAERATLRERLAALWDMAAGEDEATETIARWRSLAEARRQVLPEGSGRTQTVMRLVEAASLNTIAWQIVLGDLEVANASLGGDGTMSMPEAALRPLSTARLIATVGSGAWGEAYVQAGANPTRRLEVLRNAGGVSNLLEARVLLEETLRGATAELRGRARSLAEANADDPMVLSAMLDLSATAPAVADLLPFYERVSGKKLGSVRDAAWRVRLRQGVMERLIQRIAQGEADDVRDIAIGQRVLGGVYEQRGFVLDSWRRSGLGLAPGVLPARADDADPTQLSEAMVGATAAYVRTLYVPPAGAGVASVEDVLVVLEQRLRVARGRPQQFVARQLALLELQASVAVTRAPGQAARVREVLDGALRDAARRDADRADRVLSQMATIEQAMLELWWIALGGGE